MNKKQTAVEWLDEKLKENLKHIIMNGDYVLMEYIFLQAKEMEREEIMNAWAYGVLSQGDKTAEQYYNETYKGGENE